MNRVELIGLLRVISLIAFMAVLAFLSSCALVPRYELVDRSYCLKQDGGYMCPGTRSQVDPFERFRRPAAVVNCVTSTEHVGSHLQTVEICE
jgi:hypothetical protein